MTDIFTTPAGVPFLRTPEARFAGIEDYPWPPSYLEVEPGVRMAYVDAGPADARETLLLLHGEPMWGYLYRKMIGPMVAAGYRVIVPDLIGFGRSDKFVDGARYSYSAHVGWVTSLVRQLDLQHMTIFGQDWGGLIGGRVLAENIDVVRHMAQEGSRGVLKAKWQVSNKIADRHRPDNEEEGGVISQAKGWDNFFQISSMRRHFSLWQDVTIESSNTNAMKARYVTNRYDGMMREWRGRA